MAGDNAEDRVTDYSTFKLPSTERDDEPTAPLTKEENNELARVQREQDDLTMRRDAASYGKGAPVAIDTHRPRQSIPANMPLGVGVEVKENLPFNVSPSINEARVTALPDYEEVSGFVQPALNCLSSMRVALEAVDAAHNALLKDTSKTPEQKLLQIAGAANKKCDAVYKSVVTTQELIIKQISHTEKELSQPLTTAATTDAHKELRTVLRAMPKEERTKVIQHAVASGDETVVTAVLGAHPMASLVDPVYHQLWTRQVHEKRNPDVVRRLNAMKKSLEIVASVAPLIHTQFEAAMRGTFAKVQKLQGLSDASQKALDAILGERANGQ